MVTKLSATELPSQSVETRKCRVSEGEPQTTCAITINWDDPKAERAFATRGVVIAAQSLMRAAGDIPAELSVSVSELAKRERGGFAAKPTANNARKLMGKLDDTEYAAALRAIGINEREITRLVAARPTLPTAPVGVEAKRAAQRPGPVTTTRPNKK